MNSTKLPESQPGDKAFKQHLDVVCPGCGCLCDDLTISTRNNQIERIEPHCELAQAWFAQSAIEPKSECWVLGEESSEKEALDRAAEVLSQSNAPLIYGLSRSSTEGQRKALDLAERLRGTIDTTASVCHGPSIMAIQQVGESTSSLGEVRDRSDLVIFWGADPDVTHPRHGERYSIDAIGRWTPNGRKDRKVITIDSSNNQTSQRSDQFIELQAEQHFELIWVLRQLLVDSNFEIPNSLGIEPSIVKQLFSDLVHCNYGAIFFGLNLAQASSGHVNVQALLELVEELNARTRVVARRLRIPGDVTGADSVLCWRTGFPFAVNLAQGIPRYNPQEYSADVLLRRKEVDTAVIVGSESLAMLSPEAQHYLAAIETIVLDYPATRTKFTPTVRFETGVYGVHYEGTAYRMDEVPLPMRCLLPPPRPDDSAWLSKILARLTNS